MHRHYGTEVRGLGYPRRSASEHYPARDPSRPLTLAEYGHAPAVGVNAIDVGFIRAGHPVDMDQALVAALRCNLLGRQLGPVDKAFRIALADRNMASGVLIEQRVEEK